ncbi:MAG: hypothetical protein AAF732_20230 [Pseudomonadota bacterium]
MTIDQDQLAAIRANAHLVVTELSKSSDKPLDYDAASVAWVEQFIERQRERQAADVEGLTQTLGSYLGEAIIARAGGAWADHADLGLGIRFANESWCMPFAKVRKQFDQGLEGGESILSFYKTTIDFVATGKLDT